MVMSQVFSPLSSKEYILAHQEATCKEIQSRGKPSRVTQYKITWQCGGKIFHRKKYDTSSVCCNDFPDARRAAAMSK